MAVAGTAYLMFPFVQTVPLLMALSFLLALIIAGNYLAGAPEPATVTLWTWMSAGEFVPGISYYLDGLSVVMILSASLLFSWYAANFANFEKTYGSLGALIGLLGIGLTLVLGAGARIGALAGVAMYAFMYLASLPTVTNPFLDDHLTGAVVMIVIATVPAAWSYLGLGGWWARIAPRWLR